MKKELIYAMCVLWAGSYAFSQVEEEQIQLPEITTTISGDTVVAGKDAVPDFSRVVPAAGMEKNIMPKLPGERISSGSEEEPVADFFFGEKKNVYAQGILGGGFPGDFIGDFSVYKTSSSNPFKIEFSHFSRNGYGKNTAGDGYFDNGTKLYAEKTFRVSGSDVSFAGKYDRAGTGLQERSQNFFDMTSQKVSGTLIFDHVFGDSGFEFYSETQAYWFNRYTGIKNEGVYSDLEKNMNVFFTDPGFIFSFYQSGISVSLDCNFQFESLLGKADGADVKRLCRADASIVGGYESDLFTAFGQVGLAGGSEIGDGRSIVPTFSAGAELKTKLGSNPKTFVFALNGGLETSTEELANLERTYKFAQLTSLPAEMTDWFVNSKIVLPLVEFLSINGGVEFKRTAFENGMWEADYSSKKRTGLYGFKNIERTLVTTDSGITFNFGLFTLRGGWRAHWNHVPSNEYKHSVEAVLSYESDDEKWGFSVGSVESIDTYSDKCPNLKGSIYYNMKNVMRLSLEIEDAIKLFSGKDREYVDSDYLTRPGSATVLAKFFF